MGGEDFTTFSVSGVGNPAKIVVFASDLCPSEASSKAAPTDEV